MQRVILPILFIIFLSACGPSLEEQATRTATAQTATAASWTRTFTPSRTPTLTYTPTFTSTFTPTFTPTDTPTPTITPTFTITFTPTYDYPKIVVNKAHAACLYGPSTAYLWHYDLVQGDTGVVWGRAPVGTWLYVNMDGKGPCWLARSVVDITGDVNKMIVETIRLPITNALYAAPQNVQAVRRENEVLVSWDEVWMTEDDDRGYFLDVWVCQGGNYLWVPVGLPDQYHASYTFTDEPGCSQPSGGKLYTVEKHGYTDPVDIPWPSQK